MILIWLIHKWILNWTNGKYNGKYMLILTYTWECTHNAYLSILVVSLDGYKSLLKYSICLYVIYWLFNILLFQCCIVRHLTLVWLPYTSKSINKYAFDNILLDFSNAFWNSSIHNQRNDVHNMHIVHHTLIFIKYFINKSSYYYSH